MTTPVEAAEQYLQDYLNAKDRGELQPRIAFKQPKNNSDHLKMGKGVYGQGAYTLGRVVDRNKEDMPPDYQHSTSPELVLDYVQFEKDYQKDIATASEAGYVGVRFSESDDDGNSKYYLFPDMVPQPEKRQPDSTETDSVFIHPVTGAASNLSKRDNKWFIEGVEKEFRSKAKAVAYLKRDISFLENGGQSNG